MLFVLDSNGYYSSLLLRKKLPKKIFQKNKSTNKTKHTLIILASAITYINPKTSPYSLTTPPYTLSITPIDIKNLKLRFAVESIINGLFVSISDDMNLNSQDSPHQSPCQNPNNNPNTSQCKRIPQDELILQDIFKPNGNKQTSSKNGQNHNKNSNKNSSNTLPSYWSHFTPKYNPYNIFTNSNRYSISLFPSFLSQSGQINHHDVVITNPFSGQIWENSKQHNRQNNQQNDQQSDEQIINNNTPSHNYLPSELIHSHLQKLTKDDTDPTIPPLIPQSTRNITIKPNNPPPPPPPPPPPLNTLLSHPRSLITQTNQMTSSKQSQLSKMTHLGNILSTDFHLFSQL